MTSITYADFTSIMNLTIGDDITAINAEKVLDLAIDSLNLYDADLPNMTGTPGSKTVNLDTKERAAVFIVARLVYYSFYKDIQNASLNGLVVSTSDLMSNPENLKLIKEAAAQLVKAGDSDTGDYQVRVG